MNENTSHAIQQRIANAQAAMPRVDSQGRPTGNATQYTYGADGRLVSAQRGQLTREELNAMTPEQVVEARAEGRCDRVLGVSESEISVRARANDPAARFTLDEVKVLSRLGMRDAALAAFDEGRVDAQSQP